MLLLAVVLRQVRGDGQTEMLVESECTLSEGFVLGWSWFRKRKNEIRISEREE
jgi:hypothetical protein